MYRDGYMYHIVKIQPPADHADGTEVTNMKAMRQGGCGGRPAGARGWLAARALERHSVLAHILGRSRGSAVVHRCIFRRWG